MCVSVFNTYLALSSVFVNVNFRKVSWLVPFQTFFFFSHFVTIVPAPLLSLLKGTPRRRGERERWVVVMDSSDKQYTGTEASSAPYKVIVLVSTNRRTPAKPQPIRIQSSQSLKQKRKKKKWETKVGALFD